MTHAMATHRDALDTLNVARNLERVADHATNIAEDVVFWGMAPMCVIMRKPEVSTRPLAAKLRLKNRARK